MEIKKNLGLALLSAALLALLQYWHHAAQSLKRLKVLLMPKSATW